LQVLLFNNAGLILNVIIKNISSILIIMDSQ